MYHHPHRSILTMSRNEQLAESTIIQRSPESGKIKISYTNDRTLN